MSSTTRQVPVPGGSLHVTVDGDGPPILLAHAGIADSRSWDAVVPHLIGAGYRTVRYDTRGFGASTTQDVEFSNRADLVAVLDDLGVEQVAFVGNSRGATICLDTLIEWPRRAVAFVGVGGGISGFETDPTTEEAALFARSEAAEETGDGQAGADLDVAIWVDGVGQPPTRVPAAIREAVRSMTLPLYDPDRTFGRPIPLDPPANLRLSDVHVPVLAIVGALDTSSTHAAAERLEEAIPGARRIVVPDVAHMVGMEAPDVLAGLIVELLRPLGTWR